MQQLVMNSLTSVVPSSKLLMAFETFVLAQLCVGIALLSSFYKRVIHLHLLI